MSDAESRNQPGSADSTFIWASEADMDRFDVSSMRDFVQIMLIHFLSNFIPPYQLPI